jgi:hypothetical protein
MLGGTRITELVSLSQENGGRVSLNLHRRVDTRNFENQILFSLTMATSSTHIMRDLCYGRRNELPPADIGVAGGGDTALLRAVQGASESAHTLTKSSRQKSHCLHSGWRTGTRFPTGINIVFHSPRPICSGSATDPVSVLATSTASPFPRGNQPERQVQHSNAGVYIACKNPAGEASDRSVNTVL